MKRRTRTMPRLLAASGTTITCEWVKVPDTLTDVVFLPPSLVGYPLCTVTPACGKQGCWYCRRRTGAEW